MYMSRYDFYQRMGMPALERSQVVKVTKSGYYMQVAILSTVSYLYTKDFKAFTGVLIGMIVEEKLNPQAVEPGEYKVIQTITYAKTSNKDTYAVIVTLEALKKEKDANNNIVWVKYRDKGARNTSYMHSITWKALKFLLENRLHMW